ncbi:MAG: cyclic nucleotide-binding domain-containing protein [Gemmatimonadetes bacterium]|nr:cyclic nucleotide-binding domain-containing protein [Gemmatimonadota bacterium]
MSRVSVIPPRPSAAMSLKARGADFVATTARQCADLLETTPWAHRLSWKEEEGIGEYLRLYRLRQGAPLFHEGDQDAFVAIVVDGALEIRKTDSAGTVHTMAKLGAGKMVGEMSLIDGTFRSATAIAIEPTQLLILTREDFERMSEARPDLALKYALMIAEAIAQLLRQTTGALVEHLHH